MSDMESRLRQRLAELRGEYDKGQKTLQDLEGQAANLRATLLRISGAVQVLHESLGDGDGDRDSGGFGGGADAAVGAGLPIGGEGNGPAPGNQGGGPAPGGKAGGPAPGGKGGEQAGGAPAAVRTPGGADGAPPLRLA